MANSSPSRSTRLRDKADVTYEIALPFAHRDAEILLIERGEDEVEVIVGGLPEPSGYNLDENYPDNLDSKETMRRHAVAEWIVEETTGVFSDYDWEISQYKTGKPNYHLRDVYFTCSKDELEDAVLTAKKFINTLEEKAFLHAKRFDRAYNSPRDEL
jgi:hypothetical protein